MFNIHEINRRASQTKFVMVECGNADEAISVNFLLINLDLW